VNEWGRGSAFVRVTVMFAPVGICSRVSGTNRYGALVTMSIEPVAAVGVECVDARCPETPGRARAPPTRRTTRAIATTPVVTILGPQGPGRIDDAGARSESLAPTATRPAGSKPNGPSKDNCSAEIPPRPAKFGLPFVVPASAKF